jgi:hypothetical protein
MRHDSARIAHLEKVQSDLDWLVDHQARLIDKLNAKVSKRIGGYVWQDGDIAEIAKGLREIAAGDVAHGLRRLEALMDETEPNWRGMA